MTAKQAMELTKRRGQDGLPEELDYVTQRIKNAAWRGNTGVEVCLKMSTRDAVIQHLKSQGYRTSVRYFTGGLTRISWIHMDGGT